MSSSTENIENLLQELSGKINQDSTNTIPSKYTFKIKPMYIYGGVPLVILGLFLLVRPSFIMVKDPKTECNTINIKKVLLYTLVFTAIIDLFIYFYINKK